MIFDYKIFCFLLFLWSMVIIITACFSSPLGHAINGVTFLFIVAYLYYTMKTMVILQKMSYQKCVDEKICKEEEREEEK